MSEVVRRISLKFSVKFVDYFNHDVGGRCQTYVKQLLRAFVIYVFCESQKQKHKTFLTQLIQAET